LEYTQTELRILAVCSALGGAFSFLVGGVDAPIKYFLVLTAADYITGMIAAWKTGTLSSSKAFDGIKRKFIILAVVCFANVLDGSMGAGQVLRGWALFVYTIMEGISIAENFDRCGWGKYIPQFLRDKLIQIRDEKGVKL
jgi:toxin secretion/phage lysis holin